MVRLFGYCLFLFLNLLSPCRAGLIESARFSVNEAFDAGISVAIGMRNNATKTITITIDVSDFVACTKTRQISISVWDESDVLVYHESTTLSRDIQKEIQMDMDLAISDKYKYFLVINPAVGIADDSPSKTCIRLRRTGGIVDLLPPLTPAT